MDLLDSIALYKINIYIRSTKVDLSKKSGSIHNVHKSVARWNGGAANDINFEISFVCRDSSTVSSNTN